MTMRFDVLTLFPEIFSGYLTQSLLKLAIERGLVDVRLHNIRDWTRDKHHNVDDRPFGGGPGMILKVEPVVECVEAVQAGVWHGPAQSAAGWHGQAQSARATGEAEAVEPGHLVMLTPQGRRLTQPLVEELAGHKRLLLLCGRYEGFDDRVRQILRPDELSIGDFVLGGGEVPAMVVIDAVVRLVPGVLGDERSARDDSFSTSDRLLEFAQYTRPREFRGHAVPEVLLGGNHEEIARWRQAESVRKTAERREEESRQ